MDAIPRNLCTPKESPKRAIFVGSFRANVSLISIPRASARGYSRTSSSRTIRSQTLLERRTDDIKAGAARQGCWCRGRMAIAARMHPMVFGPPLARARTGTSCEDVPAQRRMRCLSMAPFSPQGITCVCTRPNGSARPTVVMEDTRVNGFVWPCLGDGCHGQHNALRRIQ